MKSKFKNSIKKSNRKKRLLGKKTKAIKRRKRRRTNKQRGGYEYTFLKMENDITDGESTVQLISALVEEINKEQSLTEVGQIFHCHQIQIGSWHGDINYYELKFMCGRNTESKVYKIKCTNLSVFIQTLITDFITKLSVSQTNLNLEEQFTFLNDYIQQLFTALLKIGDSLVTPFVNLHGVKDMIEMYKPQDQIPFENVTNDFPDLLIESEESEESEGSEVDLYAKLKSIIDDKLEENIAKIFTCPTDDEIKTLLNKLGRSTYGDRATLIARLSEANNSTLQKGGFTGIEEAAVIISAILAVAASYLLLKIIGKEVLNLWFRTTIKIQKEQITEIEKKLNINDSSKNKREEKKINEKYNTISTKYEYILELMDTFKDTKLSEVRTYLEENLKQEFSQFKNIPSIADFIKQIKLFLKNNKKNFKNMGITIEVLKKLKKFIIECHVIIEYEEMLKMLKIKNLIREDFKTKYKKLTKEKLVNTDLKYLMYVIFFWVVLIALFGGADGGFVNTPSVVPIIMMDRIIGEEGRGASVDIGNESIPPELQNKIHSDPNLSYEQPATPGTYLIRNSSIEGLLTVSVNPDPKYGSEIINVRLYNMKSALKDARNFAKGYGAETLVPGSYAAGTGFPRGHPFR